MKVLLIIITAAVAIAVTVLTPEVIKMYIELKNGYGDPKYLKPARTSVPVFICISIWLWWILLTLLTSQ
jgi:hypothetical protein